MARFPNVATVDAMCKCEQVLGGSSEVMVSVSGGADSDVMLDLIHRESAKYSCKVRYVFFDTGIELQATKEHLDFLGKKYGIEIEKVRAKVPVPLGCVKYGVPFLSKDISAKINTLQNNGFDFANDGQKSYEVLVEKYPKCKAGIKWWCNEKAKGFGIEANAYLKEFMIENPPDFKISAMCCWGAKKSTTHFYEKTNKIDLKCLGIRRAEGGVRATRVKNCFTDGKVKVYRPIFWFTDKDKAQYEEFYDIIHSKCYTEYGFKRTGCCGCPYNSKFEEDLEKIKDKEPLLYQAVNKIFGKSYEYTRMYREFKRERQQGVFKGQENMFNLIKGENDGEQN